YIDYQLKRKEWLNLEVHVIYAIFYLLCTNKEGFLELKKYLVTEDKDLVDPYFIAQYLLVPVNTIVNNYLLPWMMKPWENLNLVEKTKNEYRARSTKAGIFLKYTLLLDLMKIVKRHGRKPVYDFRKDKNLAKILNGDSGTEG